MDDYHRIFHSSMGLPVSMTALVSESDNCLSKGVSQISDKTYIPSQSP